MTCEKKLSLLHGLAEGLLDPREAKELEEHVSICEFCSSELKEFSRMKALVEKGLGKELSAPEVVDAVLASPPGPRRAAGLMRRALKWGGISLATVAAAMVVLVTTYLFSRGFIGPKPVAAKLAQVSVAGGKWTSDERELRGGAVVRTGAEERRSLRLNSGVVIVLNEKTGLEIESENSLKLREGEIYIDTAGKKGVILRIKTGHATTYVTGTRLGVSAEREETSVVVEEGRVRVTSDWGDQVVVLGNVYHIIESMKPEPPSPVDVEEMFLWVQERAYLSGMVVEAFEDAPENVYDDKLVEEILYGLRQSRQAIWSGDATFETLRTEYGFGYDLTEEEQDEFTEHVVAGQIAQLDERRPPSEDAFKEAVKDAAGAAMVTNDPKSYDETLHWIFHTPDRARLERLSEEVDDFVTDKVISGNFRYIPAGPWLERSGDGFRIENHPAYFGRSSYAVSDLENPRLLGTEDLDGITTYLLEADVGGFKTLVGEPARGVIQMWVDPSAGYIVPKTRIYIGMGKGNMQTCFEMIADGFEEIDYGVLYPYSFTRNVYTGKMVMGEQVLHKSHETVYTLSRGDFNMGVPGNAFDIPDGIPVTEVNSEGQSVVHLRIQAAEKQSRLADVGEYLDSVYDELRQIKQYDDPTAPGSRKLILRISREGKDRNKGAIYTTAFYNEEVVGALVLRVDPSAASYWPMLPGDIIYTLNDEPWLVRGSADIIRGLESLLPLINAGRAISVGLHRNGELKYLIIWVD
jgi:hypothetical protein